MYFNYINFNFVMQKRKTNSCLSATLEDQDQTQSIAESCGTHLESTVGSLSDAFNMVPADTAVDTNDSTIMTTGDGLLEELESMVEASREKRRLMVAGRATRHPKSNRGNFFSTSWRHGSYIIPPPSQLTIPLVQGQSFDEREEASDDVTYALENVIPSCRPPEAVVQQSVGYVSIVTSSRNSNFNPDICNSNDREWLGDGSAMRDTDSYEAGYYNQSSDVTDSSINDTKTETLENIERFGMSQDENGPTLWQCDEDIYSSPPLCQDDDFENFMPMLG